MILGIKLGRRLVAAAGLDDEQFVFRDSRFVPSRQALLDAAMGRYLTHVLTASAPTAVYCYAPTEAHSLTEQLFALLEVQAARLAIPVKRLTKFDVFTSFGILPLRTRDDLLEEAQVLWPDLTEVKTHRQLALAEAAAAALVGDLRQAWPPA